MRGYLLEKGCLCEDDKNSISSGPLYSESYLVLKESLLKGTELGAVTFFNLFQKGIKTQVFIYMQYY